MYPDTDLPPIALPAERVERARARLAEPPWERESRYRGLGLPEDMLQSLVMSPRARLFDRVVAELQAPPVLAAALFSQHAKSLRRRGMNLGHLSDETIFAVFEAYAHKKISREGILLVVQYLLDNGWDDGEGKPLRAGNGDAMIQTALDELGLDPIGDDEASAFVKKVVENSEPVRPITDPRKKHKYLMGQVMVELLGRIDGKTVSAMLDDVLGDELR